MRKDVLNQVKLIGEEGNVLNKSELARRFNCDRRTVDKYLNYTSNETRKPRVIKSKIDDFKEVIIDKVDNWGSNSMSVFRFLKKKGYDGGYYTVNNFIQSHRKQETNKATIRFDTNPRLQVQVDWKKSITIVSKQGDVSCNNKITTNQPFSKWGEIFSDVTLANAILDRLIHHSSIIKITGPSYRLKGKMDLLENKKSSNN